MFQNESELRLLLADAECVSYGKQQFHIDSFHNIDVNTIHIFWKSFHDFLVRQMPVLGILYNWAASISVERNPYKELMFGINGFPHVHIPAQEALVACQHHDVTPLPARLKSFATHHLRNVSDLLGRGAFVNPTLKIVLSKSSLPPVACLHLSYHHIGRFIIGCTVDVSGLEHGFFAGVGDVAQRYWNSVFLEELQGLPFVKD
jgi:hypothetical protein